MGILKRTEKTKGQLLLKKKFWELEIKNLCLKFKGISQILTEDPRLNIFFVKFQNKNNREI